MKNSQKIEQARKQAGIADDIRTESFMGWKRAGYSVRKGEKAVFSVKLSKPNPAGGFKTVTDYFFTEKQVEPLTARPSRRGKDTESVSESAPAVAVPSVAPVVTESAPAPVALAPLPAVAPVATEPTAPALIKSGTETDGVYITAEGNVIMSFTSYDVTAEPVQIAPVQTVPAPVVDAPADPDPVEEEPAPSFRVAFEVRRYVAHLKWSEIGNGMTAQQVYNAVVNKASRQGFPSGVNRYELDTTADAVTEYDRCKCRNDIRYWNGDLWGYTCVVTALYCVTYTTTPEEWDNAVLIDWRALPVEPLKKSAEPLQLAYC